MHKRVHRNIHVLVRLCLVLVLEHDHYIIVTNTLVIGSTSETSRENIVAMGPWIIGAWINVKMST